MAESSKPVEEIAFSEVVSDVNSQVTVPRNPQGELRVQMQTHFTLFLS